MIEANENPIALFDMDNSLVNYHKVMRERLDAMRSPFEPVEDLLSIEEPPYLRERRKAVQRDPEFWKNLPPLQLGVDLWHLASELRFQRSILTQGPLEMPQAWSGKVESIQKHFGADTPITITRNKGGYYGRILVDDWPPYCLAWLDHRPRGLVIVPAHPWNAEFVHPQVIRYDGTNLDDVRARMIEARDRLVGVKDRSIRVREST